MGGQLGLTDVLLPRLQGRYVTLELKSSVANSQSELAVVEVAVWGARS